LAVLDMDGSGGLEIAVGAYGQGAVFVHHDVGPDGWGELRVYDAGGASTCPPTDSAEHFGYDVAAGQLDLDPEEELVVGLPRSAVGPLEEAGRVHLIRSVGDPTPIVVRALNPATSSRLGESVTVGDFNGDGHGDIAASAPKAEVGGIVAGAVHVFFGPFDVVPPELVIPNPQPVPNGFFGQHLSAADNDGDGCDELFVAAIGNTAGGVPVAGQIFCFPGPVDAANWIAVEDPYPDPLDLPGPRFGMHIDAREDWLLIGANRKDWNGVFNAGMGYSARGPGYFPVTLHPYPNPKPSDYMGFRCVVADVIGDDALDMTFVVMPDLSLPDADRRALVTWDGNTPQSPASWVRPAAPGSADHFGNGMAAAQILPGGKEELVVGDGTYDRPGKEKSDNAGRVVVYFY